ncbi:MAG: 4Fe-4S binding protein [Elusimicrobia bacterium]|nr:4Fe-4S binding protein [Elusimicrobiota bacterium]
MQKVNIDIEKCKGCQLCISVCPGKCIKSSGKINKSGQKCVEFTDNDKCKSCGFCFLVCPDVAIEVFK